MKDATYDPVHDSIFFDNDVWKRIEWVDFVPRKEGEGVCGECNSLMYDGDQFCPNCGGRVKR